LAKYKPIPWKRSWIATTGFYEEHYEAFSGATNELYESVQRAPSLVADPTVATQAEFDEYDRHANEAAASLQRSNEILGWDYKTIRSV